MSLMFGSGHVRSRSRSSSRGRRSRSRSSSRGRRSRSRSSSRGRRSRSRSQSRPPTQAERNNLINAMTEAIERRFIQIHSEEVFFQGNLNIRGNVASYVEEVVEDRESFNRQYTKLQNPRELRQLYDEIMDMVQQQNEHGSPNMGGRRTRRRHTKKRCVGRKNVKKSRKQK